MAAAATTADAAPLPKKGPSLVVQIVVLLVMTLVAMGLGYVSVGFIKGDAPPEPAAADAAAAHAPDAKADAGGHGEAKKEGEDGEELAPASALPNAVMLAPITVNLAAPAETWIRCELTLIFDGPPDAAITEAIHQDLMAYMRTLKLHQVQGASGFQHLRSDIEMRARTRSDGKVSAVLFRTLLFE